ncbi:MAG: dipeptide ABC transporter ATP-binding protein DppD, partial [Rhodospirillales bacterium]|nr:dipeptide ABC transporter ATP-binding protein DppD [Rhodospirillales bacterium]
NALPERGIGQSRLPTIPGVVPGQYDRPSGCLFHPRCQLMADRCSIEEPEIEGEPGHAVRCHTPIKAGEGTQ